MGKERSSPKRLVLKIHVTVWDELSPSKRVNNEELDAQSRLHVLVADIAHIQSALGSHKSRLTHLHAPQTAFSYTAH